MACTVKHEGTVYKATFHTPDGGHPHVHFEAKGGGEKLVVGIPDFGTELSESQAAEVLTYVKETGADFVRRDDLWLWRERRPESATPDAE